MPSAHKPLELLSTHTIPDGLEPPRNHKKMTTPPSPCPPATTLNSLPSLLQSDLSRNEEHISALGGDTFADKSIPANLPEGKNTQPPSAISIPLTFYFRKLIRCIIRWAGSQKRAAQLLGVSRGTISLWARGLAWPRSRALAHRVDCCAVAAVPDMARRRQHLRRPTRFKKIDFSVPNIKPDEAVV
jgi:hypothetical protein